MSTETDNVGTGAEAVAHERLPRFTLDRTPHRFAGRVALLTNFIPPYRLRLLELLTADLRDLRIFLSVRMEGNRDWQPEWGSLDVTVQRNLSFPRTFSHIASYSEETSVHVPWDTLPQLIAFRPDVVVSAELGMRTIQAALYCLLFRKPLIVWATLSESTERNRGRMRHALRRVLLRFVDRALVNGSSGARYLAGFDFPKDRIYLVPQASDNAAFAGPATRTRGKAIRLLYTGQLIERKGLFLLHEALLRWCSAHPETQIHWTLIGSGSLRETIASWQGLANYQLDLLDPLPFTSIVAQYHAADLYVLPTLADEWGQVVNEAMIAGLPVLGSLYSQAVLDLVVDGINGWTFHPDHADELDRALTRALSTPESHLNTMRQAAIDTIAPLDQRNMADRILLAIGDASPSHLVRGEV